MVVDRSFSKYIVSLLTLVSLSVSGRFVLAQAKEPRTLSVAAIELRQTEGYESKRQFTGQVEAKRRSELGFDRVGTVQSIGVDRGDEVTAGQIIAKLDSDALYAQRRKLQADLKSAQAQLREAHAGPREETIAGARASLEEQQSQLALAEETLARREKLFQRKLIASEELDQASAAFKRWTAVVDAAKSRLNELLEGTRVEQIEAQAAVVESIEAAIGQLEVEIQKSLLKSPYDGVVLMRDVDEGSVVSPGRPVVTILENRKLEAKVGITTNFAKDLRKGQAISATCNGIEIKGAVKAIIADVDLSTRTQPVIVALEDNAWQRVVPGDTVRVTFSKEEKSNGFWVPTESLVAGPRGLWNCFVIDKVGEDGIGTANTRTVEVLHTDGERSMISGQIVEGEFLISRAPHRVIAGQTVRAMIEASSR